MKSFNAVMRMVTVGVLMTIAGAAIAQQDYPNKPIRIITPYAPGGGTSILARLIGQKLTESWGQSVIVDNRPGGSTIIGTEILVKSPPDGYTILLMTSTHVTIPILFSSLPYDAVKDFAPVATIARSEYILVVHPSVPANTLREFIAFAKSKPGQLNYASTGSGGIPHLAWELLNNMVGIKMQHIPYKGSGQALTDVIGGQVLMFINNPLTLIPHIKSGKLRAIAVSGESRLTSVPQVPTFTEAGLPGYDVGFWYGVLAPASTPKPIIDKLSREIARILVTPDFREKLISQGVDPFISNPEQFAALLGADMVKWGKVIKTANIKMD